MNYVNAKEYPDEMLMLRNEMLRSLSVAAETIIDEAFIDRTCRFFAEGKQTTLLAMDQDKAVACATICYADYLPTICHPSGNRAHIMNVYTKEAYRRKGIAKRLVEMLMDEARGMGVTHLSLDATDMGRPLYESLGFQASGEYMELIVRMP
jgi:GNAT superfamily N-acetyltransferase